MTFQLDLSNWAIDFELQDRAQEWCIQNLRTRICWPKGGEYDLKQAVLNGVPKYILAYWLGTSPGVIDIRLAILAGKDLLNGDNLNDVLERYDIFLEDIMSAMYHRSKNSEQSCQQYEKLYSIFCC